VKPTLAKNTLCLYGFQAISQFPVLSHPSHQLIAVSPEMVSVGYRQLREHEAGGCECLASVREALWRIRSAYSKDNAGKLENSLAERILEERNIYSQQTMVHQRRCS